MSKQDKTHLWIGIITRPHGVRGEVKVRLNNPESEALFEVSQVVVEPTKGEARQCDIEQCRGGAKALILALAGVQSIEDAEALRGAKIWVSRTQVAPLAPGEYYLVDLVGCGAFLQGEKIAEVVQVRPDPSVDTLVLRMNDGSEAEVPLVDAWVGDVDVQAKRVDLLSADGIIQ